jgi:DNA-binding protein HU-beta
MNKTQLVDALAARIGDRRTAASVVDGMLETIVDTVRAGGSVSISGFGVFESRARAARVARNPRTGEAVPVPATTVPAFRAGLAFRNAVGDGGRPPARGTATRRTRTAPAATAAAEAVADAPAKVARGTAPGGRKGGKKAGKGATTPLPTAVNAQPVNGSPVTAAATVAPVAVNSAPAAKAPSAKKAAGKGPAAAKAPAAEVGGGGKKGAAVKSADKKVKKAKKGKK